jgi:hypothetical protein
MCFRGINIRETSSAFTEDRAPCPPLPELYHPKRDPDCTLGGDATAVMEKDANVFRQDDDVYTERVNGRKL